MVDLLQRLVRFTGTRGLIDVGVNIGQTLLKLKSIDPALAYVGFEPNPFCVMLVQELIAMNGFEGCCLAPVALSDRPGLISFMAASEADDSASMIEDLRPGRRVLRRQHVGALVFDDLELDTEGISLVKIDVEGAESHVLSGMKRFLRERRPVVVCEVLHAHSHEKLPDTVVRNEAIVRLLRDAGYRPFHLEKGAGRIVGLHAIESFPKLVWRDASWDACDYLLVPEEAAASVRAEFEPDVRSTAVETAGQAL